jgi:DNA excision repair protein ERCC-2
MIQILGFSRSLLSNFDVGCRKLTASWVRALAAENPDIPSCEFFEQYDRVGSAAVLPPGVYTLQVFGILVLLVGFIAGFYRLLMLCFLNGL